MHSAATVLIIDDEELVLRTTKALLQADGYRLECCRDGQSGLRRAIELLPDLILLDVMMPGLDGYEVCKQLRQHPELSEVPIVMVTALDDAQSRLRGIEAGADDFIIKPYNRAELRARVRTTTRLNRYRRLVEERERFARLAELAPNGIAITTPDYEIRFANPALVKMLGMPDPVGANLLQFIDPEQRHIFEVHLEGLSGPVRSLETRLVNGHGQVFWTAVDAGVLEWERSPMLQLVIRDISEHKRYQRELERRANFDTLTGLANRNLLNDRLEQALKMHRGSGTGAVVILDLDRFRNVNETLSLACGDEVLREVARRLSQVDGPGSTAARVAGDQFALIWPELPDERSAKKLAATLLEELSRPMRANGHELVVTASLGLSLFPGLSNNREELIQQAELALYTSKQQGNCFRVYEPAMSRGLPGRLQLEKDLRQALSERHLRLHYQPRVDGAGRLVGAEALVRWQHPTRGLVAPLDFIPLAEETGLIVPVGRWVIDEVARQLAAWREAGLPLVNIGVNVSPRQFDGEDLVELCVQALRQNRVEHRWLGLEITESATMVDPEAAARTLNRLHELGIELSLDDFGTGYSSLSYLTRLPLTYLKIDRSFVQNVTSRTVDAVLASKLIQMARSLGFRTVAEGVETAEQLRFLVEHGADQLQGFYFSPPLPPEQFTRMLAERKDVRLWLQANRG